MKCNVGKSDKIIRWIIGIVLIVLGIVYKSWWGAIGLLPILTAIISFCPLYLPFGLSTCKVGQKSEK